MKRVIFVYLICIIGLFFLPIFLVKENTIEKEESMQEAKEIKLLLSNTGEIIEIDLNDYIMGVLVGEMPVTYELEALKAQAVVARTYTLNKLKTALNSHPNADMCDDINHCQAYKTKEYALSCWDDKEENEKWSKIKKAVIDTKDEIITYNGNLINAFFHANSGGKTEDISNIWGKENIPYLKSVETIYETELKEKVILSYDEINKKMKERYSDYIEIKDDLITNNIENNNEKVNSEENSSYDNIKILEKNSSGRVSKVKISNIYLEGTEARSLFGLRSTLFEISMDNDSIIFETKGYGHGVGLSQDGANSMAQKGFEYKEIIKYYYTDVKIEKI